MLYACHTTPSQKLCCLHVFRQAGPPQRVDCLVLIENGIKCLSQGHSDALPYREFNQVFATFRLLTRHLYQLSYAAAQPDFGYCTQV